MQVFGAIDVKTVCTEQPNGSEWRVELSSPPVNLSLNEARDFAKILRLLCDDPSSMHRSEPDPTFCETGKV